MCSRALARAGWSDGKIRAHESDTGSPLWLIDNAHRGGVTALVLSHNQRYIMTGGGEGDVRVWELRSRELVSHLKVRASALPNASAPTPGRSGPPPPPCPSPREGAPPT